MTLEKILRGIETKEIIGSTDVEIKGITLDSRKAERSFLFAAVRGENTDGHLHIENAIEKGAIAILLEQFPQTLREKVTYIRVKDSSFSIAKISSNYYENPSSSLKLVGVTGTNGKTTVTYIIEAIWKKENIPCGVIGTIETRYLGEKIPSPLTTPDCINLARLLATMKESGVKNVSMEVSSHSLARKRVDGCNFDAAIFTNISQDHLDYHNSMENYFEAKKRLFEEVLKGSNKKNKIAIINIDDPFGKKLVEQIKSPIITYSISEKKADIIAKKTRFSTKGIQSTINTPWGKIEIETPLVGRHNLYNILAATSATLHLGTDPLVVESALKDPIYVAGRLEKIENRCGLDVFVDYAHTPDALDNIIRTIRPLTRKRLILVFGCGGDRDKTKRPQMGKIGYSLSDIAIITSDNPRTENPDKIIGDIVKGIESVKNKKEYICISNREEAIKEAIYLANPGDIVLIAGKGHETYQIMGKEKIHFDDREIARKYLREREEKVA